MRPHWYLGTETGQARGSTVAALSAFPVFALAESLYFEQARKNSRLTVLSHLFISTKETEQSTAPAYLGAGPEARAQRDLQLSKVSMRGWLSC